MNTSEVLIPLIPLLWFIIVCIALSIAFRWVISTTRKKRQQREDEALQADLRTQGYHVYTYSPTLGIKLDDTDLGMKLHQALLHGDQVILDNDGRLVGRVIPKPNSEVPGAEQKTHHLRLVVSNDPADHQT